MQSRIVLIGVLVAAAWLNPAARAQSLPGHGRSLEASDYFSTSERCIACHSNLHNAAGEDISIGYNWRASMMANSARDPYWHAGVRRELMDHPQAREAIEDKCSTCHMPMARFSAAAGGQTGRVFANLNADSDDAAFAADGVSCTVCHQITAENFGEPDSFTGGFTIDTATPAGQRTLFGPHDVGDGLRALMQSAGTFLPEASLHLRESELCATCHTLYTHALNADGEQVGELAEQVPYLEWLNSEFRETLSCQDCHMPALEEQAAISSVLGEPRPEFSEHAFRGGNALMLGILNRFRGELGVTALPQELGAAIHRTREYLRNDTAAISIESARFDGGRLSFEIDVRNLAGHKLPTAYPSRRVWLHVIVTDATGARRFESGAFAPDGSIAGNDNDADPRRYEPHYARIERADQVQIYEPVMVDDRGAVTTGLLFGVRYVKDNRLLPRGFDKANASTDVAVFGAAADDADFTAGGDRVAYAVDLGAAAGPLKIAAELRYQSIGFRWADNLRAYDAAEPNRFIRFYEATAADSALLLAEDAVEVAAR